MNYFLLFSEGIISALNPCVLPILPLYFGYLSQNAKVVDENGNITYRQSKILLYTLFFVLGITMTFFVLALTISGVNFFFSDYNVEFMVLGGVFVVLMGLVQLEIIEIPLLLKDRRINKQLNLSNMNLLNAFMMGFLFSFSWTPCVGPALSGVLTLAASQSMITGSIMILVYAFGFILPFLVLGGFTQFSLNFIQAKQHVFKKLIKIGGIILIIMGSFMINEGFSLVHSQANEQANSANQMDFLLTDQYNEEHTLQMYEGKKVVLTFFATWCKYCIQELQTLQEIHETRDDVVILTVANPNGHDGSIDEIVAWLNEQGFTMPVLFDESGEVFMKYQVSSFPHSYFVLENGDIYGHAAGYIEKDKIEEIFNDMDEAE